MRPTFAEYRARLVEFIHRSDTRLGDDTPETPTDDPFNQLALGLFALQYRFVPPYRRLCDGRRVTPTSASHWSEIPTVPTRAFKELDFTSLPPDQHTHVFHSSGTTEQKPSRHLHNTDSLRIYEQSLLPWFQAHLLAELRAERGFIALTPPVEAAPHSSLVYMFDTIRRSIPWCFWQFTARVDAEGAYVLDPSASLEALNRATDQGLALLLLGTAFSFVHLLDKLSERNLHLQLPAGSRILETGGYKALSRTIPREDLHSMMMGRLGIPPSQIVSEYGMSELSSQAYDHIAGHDASRLNRSTPQWAFRFPPWARVRVVSPESGAAVDEGGTGLIQVFDLANVSSVMAIQTEDLGVRRGVGFELVGRAPRAEPRGCSLMTA